MQKSSAAADAVKAERARIAAIAALPEAKGQEDLALRLTMTTDMTVDQVKTALAARTSTLWDSVLTSRGMIGAAAPKAAGESAGGWDDVMKRKGFAVGAGA